MMMPDRCCHAQVLIRPLLGDDTQALYEAARESIESVGRWLPWCNSGYSLADAVNWVNACRHGWQAGSAFAYGIFDADSGRLLGGTAINQFNRMHRYANLGYWVRTSAAGQGVGAVAAWQLAAAAFEHQRLARIEILAQPGNLPSRRLALRIGARFEGVARARLNIGGRPHDAVVYGLTPADLATPAQPRQRSVAGPGG